MPPRDGSGIIFCLLMGFALLAGRARAAQIASTDSAPKCTEVELHRELRVFRDPALFLENLRLMEIDPEAARERARAERPLMATLKGTYRIATLGTATPFKNFQKIRRTYEILDPSSKNIFSEIQTTTPTQDAPMIIPVMICGPRASHQETLGFVLQSEWIEAKRFDSQSPSLPPSIHEIPPYPTDSLAIRP